MRDVSHWLGANLESALYYINGREYDKKGSLGGEMCAEIEENAKKYLTCL